MWYARTLRHAYDVKTGNLFVIILGFRAKRGINVMDDGKDHIAGLRN